MPDWRDARDVLAARWGGPAELLSATPALRALKRAVPGRRLTFLASPEAAPAARQVPEIDEVVVYDAPWAEGGPARREGGDWALAQRLRRRRFDAAVVFTRKGEDARPAALLCFLAGIPRRLAYAGPEALRLLTDRAADGPVPLGDVRRQLALVERVGCAADDDRLSLKVPELARRGVDHLLEDLALPRGRPWALIWTGAAEAEAVPDSLPEALRRLAGGGVTVVFAGPAPQEARSELIRRRMTSPSVSLVGRLGFAELTALVERAPALIAECAEAALVASALGTPVVRV
ncbi:MAG: glycosyl transferase [Elusimicrobia bacterium]|nr:glycosyl transferase [Elusimicrobiota bacterium]